MLLQLQVMHESIFGRHGTLKIDFLTVVHSGRLATLFLQADERVVSSQSIYPSAPSTQLYDWLSYP